MLNGCLCLLALAKFIGKVKGIVALAAQAVCGFDCTLLERCIVAVGRVAPAKLGNGKDAGVNHIFNEFFRWNVLNPKVALNAIDEVCLCAVDFGARVV